ncbi:MAG: hypothetical protein LCI00_33415 [Chloroflexi bacterium]|nr:hypothetical protein [Chloroflexota bacterium]MCC6897084.1 hypothetical protein [Anaerolineae bacterium]
MLQRLGLQLPDWASSKHPHVRYELGQAEQITRRARYMRAIGFSVIIVLLFVGGYVVGTNFLQNVPGQSLTESMMAILFWPTFILQLILQFAAMILTANTVSEQKRRLTWDNLRATEGGIGVGLRAKWASIYYRLRLLLGLVMGIRIILVIGILYDLTGFQGRYIDLLINNITPEVSPIVGALLLAVLMTAALLLPLTSMGMQAAIGLLIAVNAQQRIYNVMLQIILIVLRLLIVVGLIFATTQFINNQLVLADAPAWLLAGGYAAFGDWGLRFLHVGFYSEIWATIPYTIFYGVALLVFALGQSLVTEWILALSIRQAERIG